jgi:hypothetical protein
MAMEVARHVRLVHRERVPSAAHAKGTNPSSGIPDARWHALIGNAAVPTFELRPEQPANALARWAEHGSLAAGGCLLNEPIGLTDAAPEAPPPSFLSNSGRPSVDASPVATSISGLLERADHMGSRSGAD